MNAALAGHIEQRARMVAVGRSHRLAAKCAVSVEDIAAEQVIEYASPFPRKLRDAFCPPATPAGRSTAKEPSTASAKRWTRGRQGAVHLTVDALALAAAATSSW